MHRKQRWENGPPSRRLRWSPQRRCAQGQGGREGAQSGGVGGDPLSASSGRDVDPAISRRLGVDRRTAGRALSSEDMPVYNRARGPSKLDPFKERIGDLLAAHPDLSAIRVREILR